MHAANAPSKGTELTFGMADHVCRLLGSVQSYDGRGEGIIWETRPANVTCLFAERVVNYAFDLVTLIYKEHFALVVRYGSFSDLTVCVTDFSKVTKFQKISLQAIDMLRGMVAKMLQLPETALPVNPQEDTKIPLDDPMAKYWFPVLFSFYDIIMTGEDLEVRRLLVGLPTLFPSVSLLTPVPPTQSPRLPL
jgi:Sec7-like guanine-nucleotide exchange factor